MEIGGRRAIITGANRGMGRAIATAYVQAGASVLLVARDEPLLEQVREELEACASDPARQIHAMGCDVSKARDCQAVVARAQQLFGEITILVNNAGIYGPMGKIEEVDWEHWVQAIEINLFGTVLMSRAILPHMRQQKYGKIINLSGGGATAPLPGISAYAASKAAVVRVTETMAEELRDTGIDVNSLAPGALNTRLLDEVLAAGPEKVGAAFHQRAVAQKEHGGAPLEKGASLAVFLASAASDGITGRLISAVWDPWQDLPSHRDELAAGDVYTLRRIVPKDRGLEW